AGTGGAGARVPVFIVLADQPQRAVADGLRMEALRDRSLGAESVFRARLREGIEQAVRPAQDRLLGKLQSAGSIRGGRYVAINMVTAEVPLAALAALAEDPEVARIFPARRRTLASLDTTPGTMGATAFWGGGFTGGGQSIALLDTGVKTNHPAFAGKTIISQRFLTYGATDSCYQDDATTSDLNGHGTHIAGILMSQGSTGYTNFLGVAKGLGTLYNYKAGYVIASNCDGGARADDRDLVDALDAAATLAIPVINLSFGTALNANEDADYFAEVVDQISDVNDIFIAVAAGNTGTTANAVNSPAVAYNVVGVANWNSGAGKEIQVNSSRGPTLNGRWKPDIAAPGTNILSTAYNWDATPATSDDFLLKTGTSMATPHIAAGAALIRQAGITDPLQVKALILNSPDEADWAADRGWGYVNLATSFAQRTYVDSQLVAKTGFQLYTIPGSGLLKATLTWNRHVDGQQFNLRFNNLDLYAYDRSNGTQLGMSNTTIQNVERLNISAPGDAVVKVDTVAGNASAEFYGIAFSRAMNKVNPPTLTVSCTQPSTAGTNMAFAGSCTVTNSGGVPALGVTLTLSLPSGVTGNAVFSLGSIAAGSSATANTSLTASSNGTITVPVAAASSSYGESFSGAASFQVVVTTAAPNLPGAASNPSPADGTASVATGGALSWSAASNATGYDVFLGVTSPPSFYTTTTSAAANFSGLAAGTRYYWQVVARNGSGSTPSAIWSFTTAGGTTNSTSGLLFVPIAPCRLVDTRNAVGAFGGPIVAAQSSRTFPLRAHSCIAPAVPAAYSLNITVVPSEPLGYITAWPAGQAQPLTSVLNSLDGRIKANAAIVPAGIDAAINLFATNNTHIVID
ncbi:MAG: S8 family serine peptidase, partial [Acidobacteria bacterium]|nr:S8 family serine peptidase [Acidobacteriota bacterium]